MFARRVGALLFIAAVAVVVGPPVLAAQPAPSNVTVADVNGAVTISWAGTRDRSLAYRVVRGLDPKTPGDVLTEPALGFAVTSFVDAKAVPGTTYFYTVIAVYGDRSEAAAMPTQFTVSRGPRSATRALVGTVPFPKPMVPTFAGQFNQVTVSWYPLPGWSGSYEVRRFLVDPATVPAGTQPGYIADPVTPRADGTLFVIDRNADLHLPTWYRIAVAGQGGTQSAWYRRDPPPHVGVGWGGGEITIAGGYWRNTTGAAPWWGGCFKGTLESGPDGYWARVKVGSGSWIDLPPIFKYGPSSITFFRTLQLGLSSLLQPLENGEQLTVQMGPMFSTGKSQAGPFIFDLAHAQSAVVSFTPQTTPLNCAALP